MLRGIILDFEGTLVDFQWDLERGEAEAREVLSEFFGEDLSGKNYAELYNMAAEKGISHFLDPVYDRYDMDALSRWSIRDGVKRFLELVKSCGIKLAVLSNVGSKALDRALEKFGIARFFDVVVSRDDMRFLKPHPSSVDGVLERLELCPNEVVYVGDSFSDLLAARSRSIRLFILPFGEVEERRFIEAGFSNFIRSFGELVEILKKEVFSEASKEDSKG